MEPEIRPRGSLTIIGPPGLNQVHDDIVITVLLVNYNALQMGVVDWPEVLEEMKLLCRWTLDPDLIMAIWDNIFPLALLNGGSSRNIMALLDQHADHLRDLARLLIAGAIYHKSKARTDPSSSLRG